MERQEPVEGRKPVRTTPLAAPGLTAGIAVSSGRRGCQDRNLVRLLAHASEEGCSWLWLDADALNDNDFPLFDW